MNYHYYNENDPYAAQWLRNLMAAGHIPEGCVDTRSILDVRPEDLAVFTQCHFFAGIGGWPLALRLAGWPVDKHVWTGSCPCQPFSVAGKRKGNSDERHLWPYFHKLISECKPATVFGEQVASKDGREWLSGVRTDLEAVGYAVGAADLCAAGAGAPHIRQRLFWVADATEQGEWRRGLCGPGEGVSAADQRASGQSGGRGFANGMGDPIEPGLEGFAGNGDDGDQPGRDSAQPGGPITAPGRFGGLGDPTSERSFPGAQSGVYCDEEGRGARHGEPERPSGFDGMGNATGEQVGDAGQPRRQSNAPGFWDAFDVVPCADGKARRIESGTFPLAHGVPGRVGKLRAYGNAIVPQVAARFIEAFLEAVS